MRELTIDEFAKLHGKTRDAVESHIRRKRIRANKFGNQWAIDSDQEWPYDGRLEKGKYRPPVPRSTKEVMSIIRSTMSVNNHKAAMSAAKRELGGSNVAYNVRVRVDKKDKCGELLSFALFPDGDRVQIRVVGGEYIVNSNGK
jgi:hypothetical protein